MPKPDEAKVKRLLATALVREDYVVLFAGAPVDVFEAAKRLGFEGRLRVIRATDYVRVARDASTWDRV